MRLALALLLLSGCAHLRTEKPADETPGAKLFIRAAKDGKRQWFLQTLHESGEPSEPDLVFDEGNPAMLPPAGPITLTRKPFSPGVPQPGYYYSYRLMIFTDDPPAGRGAIYQFVKESKGAHPLAWWGLAADPKFDETDLVENWAKLRMIFTK